MEQLSQNPTPPGARNWDLFQLQNRDSQTLDTSTDSPCLRIVGSECGGAARRPLHRMELTPCVDSSPGRKLSPSGSSGLRKSS